MLILLATSFAYLAVVGVMLMIMSTLLGIFPVLIYLTVKHYRFKPVPKEVVDAFMKSVWNKRNKLPGYILHRGGVVDTPENTLEAIRQAKDDGCCGVEVDVDFTKDGVGVLLHDETVDRTTDGTGRVADMNLVDVQSLNSAAKHENCNKFGRCKIPTFEEAIELCLKLDLLVFIDCKGDPEKTATLLSSIFTKHPIMYERSVVCSFHPPVIHAVRKKDLAMLTALTYRKRWASCLIDGTPRFNGWKRHVANIVDMVLDFSHSYVLWYLLGTSFYLMNKDMVSREAILKWEKRGIHCVPWTVNQPFEKQYLLECLQCPIITDGVNTQ